MCAGSAAGPLQPAFGLGPPKPTGPGPSKLTSNLLNRQGRPRGGAAVRSVRYANLQVRCGLGKARQGPARHLPGLATPRRVGRNFTDHPHRHRHKHWHRPGTSGSESRGPASAGSLSEGRSGGAAHAAMRARGACGGACAPEAHAPSVDLPAARRAARPDKAARARLAPHRVAARALHAHTRALSAGTGTRGAAGEGAWGAQHCKPGARVRRWGKGRHADERARARLRLHCTCTWPASERARLAFACNAHMRLGTNARAGGRANAAARWGRAPAQQAQRATAGGSCPGHATERRKPI